MNYIEILKSHPYISQHVSINKYSEPYNYYVIDNLLKPEIYEKICKRAPEYIAKQPIPQGQIGDTGLYYNATIYSITKEDCKDGFDFFNSKFWKDFTSKLFDIQLNQHNALSLHWHKGSPENPSKSGWSHCDLGICSAIDDPLIDVKLLGDCEYADDTINRQKHTTKIMRSIAILYYFNNKEPLEKGDGGGTGIYESYEKDSIIAEVRPLNNRVFLFEVCPKSFHGFVGAKFDRTAIVHWFHSCPSYIVKRHEKLFRDRYKSKIDFFEYWKKEDRWSLDMDPEYYNYFERPFDEEFIK
jgi:hypothetical protein